MAAWLLISNIPNNYFTRIFFTKADHLAKFVKINPAKIRVYTVSGRQQRLGKGLTVLRANPYPPLLGVRIDILLWCIYISECGSTLYVRDGTCCFVYKYIGILCSSAMQPPYAHTRYPACVIMTSPHAGAINSYIGQPLFVSMSCGRRRVLPFLSIKLQPLLFALLSGIA